VTSQDPTAPVQDSFTYEVRLNVSIPIAWAQLLKEASKHHYDARCRALGDHGVINGLFNTARGTEWPSFYPVSHTDLNITTKVAEQLEYHTHDHALIRTIRSWLRETMRAIERQHKECMKLPGSESPHDQETT